MRPETQISAAVAVAQSFPEPLARLQSSKTQKSMREFCVSAKSLKKWRQFNFLVFNNLLRSRRYPGTDKVAIIFQHKSIAAGITLLWFDFLMASIKL